MTDERAKKIVPIDDAHIVETEDEIFLDTRNPEKLLTVYRRKRRGWLGHFRSFLGVNSGLAAINLITGLAAEPLHPWFLYVTASWGIGLVIHGLNYRGWVKDHKPLLRRAEMIVEQIDGHEEGIVHHLGDTSPSLPQERSYRPALPAADAGWDELIGDCSDAVSIAQEALASAEMDGAEREILHERLEGGLQVVDEIKGGALAVRAALTDVAPEGGTAIEAELQQIMEKISATADERLKKVYEANRRLLEARRDKVRTLESELERMRATVKGFLMAAQNIRLDAARLGTGQVPELLGSLSDSLDRLNDEVEVARQVENELESL